MSRAQNICQSYNGIWLQKLKIKVMKLGVSKMDRLNRDRTRPDWTNWFGPVLGNVGPIPGF